MSNGNQARNYRVQETLDFSDDSASSSSPDYYEAYEDAYYDRLFVDLDGSPLFTDVCDYFIDEGSSSTSDTVEVDYDWSPNPRKRSRDTSDTEALDAERPRKKRRETTPN